MASRQSEVVKSRQDLENDYKSLYKKYESNHPECPDYWGGYKVVPLLF